MILGDDYVAGIVPTASVAEPWRATNVAGFAASLVRIRVAPQCSRAQSASSSTRPLPVTMRR